MFVKTSQNVNIYKIPKLKKNRLIKKILPVLLLIPLLCSINSLNARQEEYFFLFYDPGWGFTCHDEAIERLTPFCKLLSAKLNKNICPVYIKKKKYLEELLKDRRALLGILDCKIVLDNLEKGSKLDLHPLLIPVRDGEIHQKKVLVVPQKLPKISLQALKGKRLAILEMDKYNIREQLCFITPDIPDDPFSYFGSVLETVSPKSAILSLILDCSSCAFITFEGLQSVKKKYPVFEDHLSVFRKKASTTFSPIVRVGNNLDSSQINKIKNYLIAIGEQQVGKREMALINVEAFRVTDCIDILYENKRVSSYIIQKGDSLWKISKQNMEQLKGNTMSKTLGVASMNRIENHDKIYPGDQLIIPKVGKTKYRD